MPKKVVYSDRNSIALDRRSRGSDNDNNNDNDNEGNRKCARAGSWLLNQETNSWALEVSLGGDSFPFFLISAF